MALKASMKILIIDPNSGIRQATRKMLTEVGFKNVVEVGDEVQAWKVINESIEIDKPVEFIISEYELSKGSGIDFLQTIRSHKVMASTPFLMITGQAEQQVIVQSIKAGANNFLVKPFSSVMLQEKIAAIFKQGNSKKAA
jgi:two-component system chemotaxis response regulator CheY